MNSKYKRSQDDDPQALKDLAEKLGFTGRGEGIAAEAAVVLARRRA